ncbi:MAG: hypothetical protein ACPLRW_07490 [Moorellales bacterium]
MGSLLDAFRFLVGVLKELPPGLVALDFALYALVTAVGGLWLCSWSEPQERAWGPPWGGVVPVLALTRRLFFGRVREAVFADSLSAQVRSAVGGRVVFPLCLAAPLALDLAAARSPAVKA